MRKFQFYIVPTPIGNIQDITLRAIDVLKNVDVIACEDSRVTQKLLNHYDIKTKCISYHKYNEKQRVDFFLNLFQESKTVALVSDAGTPMICDPGAVLLKALHQNNVEITALPGACAVTTFLSQIERDGEEFAFVGFLPKIQSQIEKIVNDFSHVNTVFYESPNRILKTVEIIKKIKPEAKIIVGRELSKVFEEITDDFDNFTQKGEIVAMIYKSEDAQAQDLSDKIEKLKSKGFKAKEISIILSEICGANKNEIYKRLI